MLQGREFHPGHEIDQGKRVIIVVFEQVSLVGIRILCKPARCN